MLSAVQAIVCACLAFGAQVQANHHRAHDSHVALRQTPFRGATPAGTANTGVSTAAYFIADSCSEPAQCVSDPAECDVAASTLGLAPGYLPSATYGGYCAKWDAGMGGVNAASSTWYYYHANNQAGAQSICKLPPYIVGTTSTCDPGYSGITDTSECDTAAAALGFTQGSWGGWDYGGACAQWDGGSGSTTWYYHYASNQNGAKPICKLQKYTIATTSCPNGFEAITSTSECDAAGTALGYTPGPWMDHAYGGSCAAWAAGWGVVGGKWYWHFASTETGASLMCVVVTAPPTPSPTPAPPTASPTPYPTPSPTPIPIASQNGIAGGGLTAVAAATGDPHLQNIRGERFDVMKQGRHVLVNIPRGISAENALLRVEAEARRLGGRCSDMYFQVLNVTGAWAEVKQRGGYRFQAKSADSETPKWIAFEKVELKVVHGRTPQGMLYLNFYVKHLGRAGLAVGGLLGEDDHSDAALAPAACMQRISLLAGNEDKGKGGPTLSEAVALLE